jgi:hypothetical protein
MERGLSPAGKLRRPGNFGVGGGSGQVVTRGRNSELRKSILNRTLPGIGTGYSAAGTKNRKFEISDRRQDSQFYT